MDDRVSIIIPTLNSPLIARTVDSLWSQTVAWRIAEVLVIGLDDRGLIRDDSSVCFIDTGKPVTAPVARNIGIRRARGGYLAFIDADCIADKKWLERLLAAHDRGHPVVGGGIDLESQSYWQLCYNLTMFHEFLVDMPAGPRRNMGTLNLCVTREVVEQVGLMDERLDRGQDTEWTLRMRRYGYTLHFSPDAIVTHVPAVRSFRDILFTWYRSGVFNASVRRQYRDLIAPAPFDGKPWLQKLMAPLIAFGVTVRIFARDVRLLRYVHTVPVIFATKVAWCWGASHSHDLDFE